MKEVEARYLLYVHRSRHVRSELESHTSYSCARPSLSLQKLIYSTLAGIQAYRLTRQSAECRITLSAGSSQSLSSIRRR